MGCSAIRFLRRSDEKGFQNFDPVTKDDPVTKVLLLHFFRVIEQVGELGLGIMRKDMK